MTQLLTLDDLNAETGRRQRVSGGAVSIGNFDGVHLGHRELLTRVHEAARRCGGPAVAVVLDPHPAAVLRPHSAPPRLTSVARRAELMTELGIDYLIVCPATLDFLHRTADEFFQFLIRDRLAARAMVEGPNFFFGRDRGGDISRLRQLCEQAAIDVTIVEPRVEGERMISSSRIRELIASGEIERANAMLGSPYQLRGRVIAGAGRGRRLGFPTANLSEIDSLLPGRGVYAAVASKVCSGAEASAGDGPPVPNLLAAVHVGPNPTFDDHEATKVEVHLLDYAGDLYDHQLSVHLIAKVRDVRKFADADALKDQLRSDLKAVRDLGAV